MTNDSRDVWTDVDENGGTYSEKSSFADCQHCQEGFIMADGVARECDCRKRKRVTRRLEDACIPDQFRRLSTTNLLESADLQPISDSVLNAIDAARRYVARFEKGGKRNSLLLIGPLAVASRIASAVLSDLIVLYGITGRYFEWKGLLTKYGAAQDAEDLEAEKAIYNAIDSPEAVVLNEVGAVRLRESGWDRINTLFNSRYSACLPTIATTTYWNHPITATLAGKVDYPGYFAKRVTLGDQIGERARSRIAESSTIVSFSQTDPCPLTLIFSICEVMSAAKGWTYPIYAERARGFFNPVTEIRFDDFGNIYLQCDQYETGITNFDLYSQIKTHQNRSKTAFPLPEAAAHVQPMKVWSTRYHDFTSVTGAFLSDAGLAGGPKLIFSPFSREVWDFKSEPRCLQ